ncbi:MAG: TolC family protein [Sphingomonadales bacterium]|nr:TolC family protein [Sphingomonadales bacterium]PIX67214.1 MAG: TolC family protein [Sphingomonadales bacterium CG_4_10_14_3_um_filter_58_15]NCO48646.1 TolC family protein [Sphingomonadales bacterium]NCO99609.1 TolC family protein [Sphingomonadales bacterium]NCP27113.1 TolC family protein [Sphingomonadales bacterium]
MLGKVQADSIADDFVKNRFHNPLYLLFAIATVTSGCASMAPDSTAPEIAAGVPAAFDKTETDGAYQPAGWWTAFEDPVLDKVLDEALAKNLDLAEASARLRAAEARARISKSGLFPQVNAGLNSSYSDSPTAGTSFGAIAGTGAGPNRLQNETYSSSLTFSYELDIWGKLRNDARAGRADAIAAVADLQAVRLAVLAESITSYFDIVDARHQIALTTKIIDVLGDRVEQTEDRYRRGLVTSFELYQVRQDFRTVQASLPQRESQLAATEGQLAVLVGRYSNNMNELIGKTLTPKLIFEPVPAGLPIDLLVQRPDVFAESQRLESARYNLGARRAERFPSLSLSAGSGSQAGSPADALNIFDNWILNLGAGLTAPLFQGGRIKANIEVADAQYAQQTAVYARTVLTAYQEVGTAIERYEEERQRYRFLFSQLDEAQATAELQSRRFANGVGSYVDYLDALRAQYQVQSSLSSAARDVALARLGVHRALGGSWDAAPRTADIMTGPPAPQGDK